MKRKDPTKTSPVKTKKGRTSIGEISSPAPAALSVEEQKRRAKEWFENEERKKLEASATKPNRSTTPTTKTPAKKEKRQVEEEPAPRSTRKSARAVETPSKNRTLSAKVEVEFIESDDEEEEEEEEVVAPAPKSRKTSSAQVAKEEPVLAVKAPRSARKAAPAKASTPKLTPDADSPVVEARKTALEIEREKAQAWYQNEMKRKAEEEAAKSASKSATKAPKSATKVVKSTTTTPAKPAAASAVRPAGHPVASATSSSSSPAACPFAFPTEPERESPTEQTTSTSTSAVAHNDAHQIHCVSAALALVPLGVVAYYDPKIAVTALVILFVASVVRRIIAMIMDAEKNI